MGNIFGRIMRIVLLLLACVVFEAAHSSVAEFEDFDEFDAFNAPPASPDSETMELDQEDLTTAIEQENEALSLSKKKKHESGADKMSKIEEDTKKTTDKVK